MRALPLDLLVWDSLGDPRTLMRALGLIWFRLRAKQQVSEPATTVGYIDDMIGGNCDNCLVRRGMGPKYIMRRAILDSQIHDAS